VCYRLRVAGVFHSTQPLAAAPDLKHSGPPSLRFTSEGNFFIEFIIHVDLCRLGLLDFGCRHTSQALRNTVVYCCLTITGSSSLFRRRYPHSQHRYHAAPKLVLRGEHNNDLPLPAVTGIAKGAAECAVIGLVQHKTAGIVGKPNAELA